MKRAIKPLLAGLFALLIPGAALLANGQTPSNGVAIGGSRAGPVRLHGNAQWIRLEVRDSTVAAVLAAMGGFNVQYRSATPLDAHITGTYAGSLTGIIARVLDGYDYVMKYEDSALDVAILGRSQGRPVPALARGARPAATAPVRRCGRSAGHQAACLPI